MNRFGILNGFTLSIYSYAPNRRMQKLCVFYIASRSQLNSGWLFELSGVQGMYVTGPSTVNNIYIYIYIGTYFCKNFIKYELLYLLTVAKLNTFRLCRLQVLLYFMTYIFNSTWLLRLCWTKDLILQYIYLSRIAKWEYIILFFNLLFYLFKVT